MRRSEGGGRDISEREGGREEYSISLVCWNMHWFVFVFNLASDILFLWDFLPCSGLNHSKPPDCINFGRNLGGGQCLSRFFRTRKGRKGISIDENYQFGRKYGQNAFLVLVKGLKEVKNQFWIRNVNLAKNGQNAFLGLGRG